MDIQNPEKIEIEGLKTIHKLCKFGADHNMEGCSFTEIVERMFSKIEQMKTQVNTLDEILLNQGEALAQTKAQAVPEESKHEGGYYLQDCRGYIGNCMKFWYTHGYGAKLHNFHWFPTLDDALKAAGGAPWHKPWYAPYVDSLAEKTIDMQLADREQEKAMIEAQENS